MLSQWWARPASAINPVFSAPDGPAAGLWIARWPHEFILGHIVHLRLCYRLPAWRCETRQWSSHPSGIDLISTVVHLRANHDGTLTLEINQSINQSITRIIQTHLITSMTNTQFQGYLRLIFIAFIVYYNSYIHVCLLTMWYSAVCMCTIKVWKVLGTMKARDTLPVC